MLTDPEEIRIASKAKQKNVRDPARSRQHFFNIIRDFFAGIDLSGRYLDLGPGQFDFGEIIREKGGQTVGVDFDPVVCELGRYKTFDVIQLEIQDLPEHRFSERFDGVFNKFALNAFWYWADEGRHRRLVDSVCDLVKHDGWGWIGPWNGVPKSAELEQDTIEAVLDAQRRFFEAHGFETISLNDEQSRLYGLHGAVANNVVFIKNLRFEAQSD